MWSEGEAFNMRHGHGLSAQGHQFIKTRLPCLNHQVDLLFLIQVLCYRISNPTSTYAAVSAVLR
jgi:hypothetical protein